MRGLPGACHAIAQHPNSLACVGVQAAGDMADGALWLYHLAFEELQRSVTTECRERGDLLGACWCVSIS